MFRMTFRVVDVEDQDATSLPVSGEVNGVGKSSHHCATVDPGYLLILKRVFGDVPEQHFDSVTEPFAETSVFYFVVDDGRREFDFRDVVDFDLPRSRLIFWIKAFISLFTCSHGVPVDGFLTQRL